jgi:diguanylate cyclase (GGDEF)-like protein
VDLDDFGRMNDRYGRATGDLILRTVAERLQGCLRADDIPARLGSDEFAVLLVGVPTVEDLLRRVDHVVHVLNDGMTLAGQPVAVRATAGIAICESALEDATVLMHRASLAMLVAKSGRKGGHALYQPGMEETLRERITLRAELSQALSREEFLLLYQPIIDLDAERTVGFEALIRWRNPRLGTLTPDSFLPELEGMDLMCEVGAWVMSEASRQIAAWRAEFGERLYVTVNVASTQLLDCEFPQVVRRTLDAHQMPGSALILELTESGVVDHDQALARLSAVRCMGVRVALDDFGTGYSSLAYLQQFPVDVLKVDKSFIRALPAPGDRPTVAEALIHLGAALGLTTVAEGIETPGQHHAVRRSGCSLGQGYLFAKPLSPWDAAHRLRAEAGRVPGLA